VKSNFAHRTHELCHACVTYDDARFSVDAARRVCAPDTAAAAKCPVGGRLPAKAPDGDMPLTM